MGGLTHFDETGNAVMVDVGEKPATDRVAMACGTVHMSPESTRLIQERKLKKGDVLSVAQLAGIMGAKKTPDLIPLCHPVSLTSVSVELTVDACNNCIVILATCKTSGQTGVEMEALTAVSVTALTIYDMCKAVDKSMEISEIFLTYKAGGKSGVYEFASDETNSACAC
ncbi:cyclic pyranopterin monophosphate synthase MoaC [Magnetovibrio sp. PR-2]|uniref:cyclic pyranopterin monophosphate synthase MoaC n=1 Tax=Magnetovibrio sp. PR-2 TaxID=3120356 RepID=UPI002FCE3F92